MELEDLEKDILNKIANNFKNSCPNCEIDGDDVQFCLGHHIEFKSKYNPNIIVKKCKRCGIFRCTDCLQSELLININDSGEKDNIKIERSGLCCKDCDTFYNKCEICSNHIINSDFVGCNSPNCLTKICNKCFLEGKGNKLCEKLLLCEHQYYYCSKCIDETALAKYKKYSQSYETVYFQRNYLPEGCKYIIKDCCNSLVCNDCTFVGENCSECNRIVCKGCLRNNFNKVGICKICEHEIYEKITKDYLECSMHTITSDLFKKYMNNGRLDNQYIFNSLYQDYQLSQYLTIPCISIENIKNIENDVFKSNSLFSYRCDGTCVNFSDNFKRMKATFFNNEIN